MHLKNHETEYNFANSQTSANYILSNNILQNYILNAFLFAIDSHTLSA